MYILTFYILVFTASPKNNDTRFILSVRILLADKTTLSNQHSLLSSSTGSNILRIVYCILYGTKFSRDMHNFCGFIDWSGTAIIMLRENLAQAWLTGDLHQ